jgi:Zn-finger nucleic acid-binding protein
MASCPECSSELVDFTVRGVRVRSCATCSGLWFDRDNLSALCAETMSPAAEVELATPSMPAGVCPHCWKSTLNRGVLATRPVALCSECRGVWVPKAITPDSGRDTGDFAAMIIDALSFLAPFF